MSKKTNEAVVDDPQNSFQDYFDRKEIDLNKLDIDLQSTKYPDAKLHQLVSFIKSGIRILGYAFIPFNLTVACVILIISELIGIYEELV
tara:strand:- start:229 stop:495 length:267 start_codon:yes stop_codon:yes gene_type:complete